MISEDSGDNLFDEFASAFTIFVIIFIAITFFRDSEIFSKSVERMVMRDIAFFKDAVVRSMFMTMSVIIVTGRS